MESLPDDLLLRVFTIGLVELGEPRLPVVVEDEDGLDHGWAGADRVGAGARAGQARRKRKRPGASQLSGGVRGQMAAHGGASRKPFITRCD